LILKIKTGILAKPENFGKSRLAGLKARPQGSECATSSSRCLEIDRSSQHSLALVGWATCHPNTGHFEIALNLFVSGQDVLLGCLIEVAMAAIARVLARKFPTTRTDVEILKQLGLFCAAGLLVSLLMMTYGLDLSPGFF
jgi:hypothetical protein